VTWLNHPVVEPLIVVKLVKQLVCFNDNQQTACGPEIVPYKLIVTDFTARFLTIRDACVIFFVIIVGMIIVANYYCPLCF